MALTKDEVEQVVKDAVNGAISVGKSPKLETYTGHRSRDLDKWLDNFGYLALAQNWDETMKLSKVPLYLADSAREWYNMNVRDLDDKDPKKPNTWAELVDALKTFFTPTDQDDYLRDALDNRTQGKDESVIEYILAKKALCKRVNGKMDEKEMIRQLYKGMDPKIAVVLRQHRPQSLDAFEEKCKDVETSLLVSATSSEKCSSVEQDMKVLIKSFADIVKCNANGTQAVAGRQTSGPNNEHHRFQDRGDRSNSRTMNGKPKCFECGKVGHIAKNCRFSEPNQARHDYRRDDSRERNHVRFEENRRRSPGYQDDPNQRWQQGPNDRGWHPQTFGYNDYNGPRNGYNDQGQPWQYRRQGHPDERALMIPGGMFSGRRPWSRDSSRDRNQDQNYGSRDNSLNRGPPQQGRGEANVQRSNIVTISRAKADGLHYLNTRVYGRRYLALVDTGSMLTIASSHIVPFDLRQGMKQYIGPLIKAASGDFLNTVGIIDMPIVYWTEDYTGQTTLPVVVVQKLEFDLLLGNDFNKSTGLVLHPKSGYLGFVDGNQPTCLSACFEKEPMAPNVQEEHSGMSDMEEASSLQGKPTIGMNEKVPINHSNERQAKRSYADALGQANVVSVSCTDTVRRAAKLVRSPKTDDSPRQLSQAENKEEYRPESGQLKRSEGSVREAKSQRPPGSESSFKEQELAEGEESDETPDCEESEFVAQQKIANRDRKESQIMVDPEAEVVKTAFGPGHILTGKTLSQWERGQLLNLLQSQRSTLAFEGDKLGLCSSYKHKIDTSDHLPVHQNPYQKSDIQRQLIQREVDELLADGRIVPSRSPWSSPIVMVPKKDGTKRMCVDYRKLNRITKRDTYPLPNIQNALDQLRGAKYFTSLDLKNGYHQIALHPDDAEKTAFVTQDGLWQYTVLPFGLCNAPSAFQRCMDKCLAGLKHNCCIVYLDDIIIFSKTFEQHLEHLALVLERLAENSLTLKPTKCAFGLLRVRFLGHILSHNSIEMDPDKVKAVNLFPAPQSLTDVRSFIGFAGYYRNFMKDFSRICEPLTRLTRKNVTFVWEKEQQSAFEAIKELMINYPVLVPFDPSLPTELRCDACGIGIGAVLVQNNGNGFRPVHYLSRLLNDAEKRYSTTDKECLAIVWACNKLRPYLEGMRFTIVTDHKAIVWLKVKSRLSDRHHRYTTDLQSFDFDLEYRRGKNNRDADALSRAPVCSLIMRADASKYLSYYDSDEWFNDSDNCFSDNCSDTEDDEERNLYLGELPFLDDSDEDEDAKRQLQKQIKKREALYLSAIFHKYSEPRRSVVFPEQRPVEDGWRLSGYPYDNYGDIQYILTGKEREDRSPSAIFNSMAIHAEDHEHVFEAEDLVREQYEDPMYAKKIDMLLHSPPSEVQSAFCLIDGILYKKLNRKTGVHFVICLPKAYREDILFALHDDPIGGHLGLNKTYEKVVERYFWPNMREYIQNYIKSCRDCSHRKDEKKKPAGLLQPIEVGDAFDMIGIDLLGPFKRSEQGNTFVIVATDYLTKYCEMKAIADGSAWEVARFIVENVLARHGAPRKLLTDRGKCFMSELCLHICEIMSTKKIFTTHYHPQCDGLVESFNKTLAQMISFYVSEGHNDWDRYLSLLQFAYNTSIQHSTGYSPFYLVYGRNARLPIDTLLPTPSARYKDDDYARKVAEVTKKVRDYARRRIAQSQEKNKRQYDSRHRPVSYTIGDLILLKVPRRIKGLTTKLLHQYTGPWRILKKLSDLNYQIESMSGKKVVKVAHVKFMKKFYGRELIVSDSSSSEDEDEEDWEPVPDKSRRTAVFEPPAETIVSVDENETNVSRSTIAGNLPRLQRMDVSSDYVNFNPTMPELQLMGTPTESFAAEHTPTVGDTTAVEETTATAETAIAETCPTDASQPSPNTNVPTTLRRSARGSKPVKPFWVNALLLLSLLTFAESSFQRVNPIVWRTSERPVIAGLTRVAMSVEYESPCVIFNYDPWLSRRQLAAIYKPWCDDAFEKNFLTPIERFCEAPSDSRSIAKREIITAITIGTLVVSIFSTIGVTAYSVLEYKDMSNKVQEMRTKQADLLKKLVFYEDENLRVRNLTDKLESAIEDVGIYVRQLAERFDQHEKDFATFGTSIAHLAARFNSLSDRFLSIGRDWESGIFNPALLDIFNLTLPCKDKCPMNLHKPRKCIIDRIRRTVVFHFDMNTVKSTASVLKADPFRLVKTDDETGKFCFIEYTGPPSVIYDSKQDCITPIRGMPSEDNVILAPTVAICSASSPLNSSDRYWKVAACEEKKNLDNDELIQVKSSQDYNYVYCPYLNVTLFNRTVECPPFVFSLPITASFSLGSLEYSADQIRLQNTLQVVPTFSHRVNFHMLPGMHNFNFEKKLQEARMLLHETPRPSTILGFDEPNHGQLSLYLIMLGCMCFFVYRIWYYLHKRALDRTIDDVDKRLRRTLITTDDGGFEDIDEDKCPIPTEDIELGKSKLRLKPSISKDPKPRKKAAKVLFMTALIFCLQPADSCPKHLSLILSYRNPCLNTELNLNPNQLSWCNQTFENDFIQPISKTCVAEEANSLVVNKGLFRAKRADELGLSYLAARLPFIRDYISAVTYRWQEGEISDVLSKNLGLNQVLPNNCPLALFVPHFCYHDRTSRTVVLHLDRSTLYFLRVYKTILTLFAAVCTVTAIVSCYCHLRSTPDLMERSVRFECLAESAPFEPLPPPNYNPAV